ncbi:MAG: hypothetical protein PHN30_02465 [Bacteroidales bacterium]|jgi:hypothetical protein|nr:hypothetical protein [Bacteroidales bacterium]NLO68351.1 hypothetical protein [Bacteroidales bacterium]
MKFIITISLASLLMFFQACNPDQDPEDLLTGPGEVEMITLDAFENLPMGQFRMDTVYIDGDSLRIQVKYSGGCKPHEFRLWKVPVAPGDQSPIELMLSHEDNGDTCEALFTVWLAYSLDPIRIAGLSEVAFLMRGSPEMSIYYGDYTYRY